MTAMSLGIPVRIGQDGDVVYLTEAYKRLDEENIHRCPNGDVSACEFCKLLNIFSIVSRTFKLR